MPAGNVGVTVDDAVVVSTPAARRADIGDVRGEPFGEPPSDWWRPLRPPYVLRGLIGEPSVILPKAYCLSAIAGEITVSGARWPDTVPVRLIDAFLGGIEGVGHLAQHHFGLILGGRSAPFTIKQ